MVGRMFNNLFLFSRQQIDFCANNPCPEGHQCSDHGNDFSCDCPEGRNGPDCSQVPRTVSCFNVFFLVWSEIHRMKNATRLNRNVEHKNTFHFIHHSYSKHIIDSVSLLHFLWHFWTVLFLCNNLSFHKGIRSECV